MKSKAGRPAIVDEIVLQKLEEAFSIGATDIEACGRAGISTSTLYNYQEAHPEFLERKNYLKDMPKYQARYNIVEAIKEGDKDMSKWYAERKVKEEFSTRQETTGKDGEPLSAAINMIQPNGD